MIEVLGKKLYCVWIVNKKPLAYSLHYTKDKAFLRTEKIKNFHSLKGKIIENKKLDKKLENKINHFLNGKKAKIELSPFNYREVYKELLKLKKGETTTYSELSIKTGLKIYQVIQALANNPMLILIPCHRVIRKDGKISGYTPLGKEFKVKLLKKEKFMRKIY